MKTRIWSFLFLSLFMVISSFALRSWSAGTNPDELKAQIELNTRQADEISQNLRIAQAQLETALRHRSTALTVVLPLSVAATVVGVAGALKGDPKGWASIWSSPTPGLKFRTSLSRFMARSSVLTVGGDAFYLIFVNRKQLEEARVNVIFLSRQMETIRRSLSNLRKNRLP